MALTRLHRYLDKRARWLAPISALGLVVPIVSEGLAGSSNTLEWLVDLASHWQWLYLAGLVLACAIMLWGDRRWVLWLLAVPLFWLTASDLAPDIGHERVPNDSVLTVATANVHLDNLDTAALVRWLDEARPDVLILHEVSPDYAKGLDTLKGFPFRLLAASTDPFGVAVLSRFPLAQVHTVEDEDRRGLIEAMLDWNGQPVSLIAWHPMPPLSQYDHTMRNRQLHTFAKAAQTGGQPAIVAGDLNASPWSNAFSKLDQAGLRRATGLTPTWPAIGRGWLGIPIDHVLVTPQWSLVERSVGPHIGSDHLPVMVRIALHAGG